MWWSGSRGGSCHERAVWAVQEEATVVEEVVHVGRALVWVGVMFLGWVVGLVLGYREERGR